MHRRTLRIEDTLLTWISLRARENQRSVQGEIIFLLKQIQQESDHGKSADMSSVQPQAAPQGLLNIRDGVEDTGTFTETSHV